MSAKLRAHGFTPAAVLVLAVLMAWVGGWVWHQLDRLRKDFSVVQSESFHLAEHVEEKMLALKETLRSLDIRPDAAAMADFRSQATEVKLWVQTSRSSVISAQQRDVLDRIEAAFDVYVMKTNPSPDPPTRSLRA
jgi:hypothetical protein